MKKLKIALIGVGHLGKIHLKCIRQTECWELAGIFDANEAQAEKVAAEFNCHKFNDLESLFAACDAVDIVTPTPAHFKVAQQALRAGKHVFVEKPVTQTVAEARKLLVLAEKTGLKVQVGHVERFNPAMLALGGATLKPMFIEAHRLALFQPRGTEVSVILDLMIHDLDLVLKLVGSPVKKVSASGVAVMSQTPDIANARLEFENGCTANLTASRISVKQMRKMRLFQPNAYISLDFLEKQTEVIRLFDLNAPDLPPTENLMEFDTPGGKKWLQMQMPEVVPINAIQRELETFAEAILGDTEPIVSLRDGYEALRVAHLILKKIDLRQQRHLG